MIFVYITFGVVLLWALLTGNLWNIIRGVFFLAVIIALGIGAVILVATYEDEVVEFLILGAALVVGAFLAKGIHHFCRWVMGRPPPTEDEP